MDPLIKSRWVIVLDQRGLAGFRRTMALSGALMQKANSERLPNRIPRRVAVSPDVSRRMARPSPILGLIAGGALAAVAALWQPGIRVVDGDTVDHGFWRWRLEGYDAPETGSRARCHEERVLGQSAKLRLAEAVETGKAVLVPVGSIWRVDRYGRRLGRLAIDGRDAGDILTAEGLARPYAGGERAAWCAG